jgi:hypothetical protein
LRILLYGFHANTWLIPPIYVDSATKCIALPVKDKIGVETGVEVEVEYVPEKADKKDGGMSNKKKLESRMKITHLKQICNRPDVVEVRSCLSLSLMPLHGRHCSHARVDPLAMG